MPLNRAVKVSPVRAKARLDLQLEDAGFDKRQEAVLTGELYREATIKIDTELHVERRLEERKGHPPVDLALSEAVLNECEGNRLKLELHAAYRCGKRRRPIACDGSRKSAVTDRGVGQRQMADDTAQLTRKPKTRTWNVDPGPSDWRLPGGGGSMTPTKRMPRASIPTPVSPMRQRGRSIPPSASIPKLPSKSAVKVIRRE